MASCSSQQPSHVHGHLAEAGICEQPPAESLFYYFRIEDQIPKDHLLRLIDEQIDLSFVCEPVKNLYSATGRPSIDPEVLLRLLLLRYLYGITSERRLLEEVRMLWVFSIVAYRCAMGKVS